MLFREKTIQGLTNSIVADPGHFDVNPDPTWHLDKLVLYTSLRIRFGFGVGSELSSHEIFFIQTMIETQIALVNCFSVRQCRTRVHPDPRASAVDLDPQKIMRIRISNAAKQGEKCCRAGEKEGKKVLLNRGRYLLVKWKQQHKKKYKCKGRSGVTVRRKQNFFLPKRCVWGGGRILHQNTDG